MAISPATRAPALNLLIPVSNNIPGAPRSKPFSSSPSSRYAMTYSLKQLNFIAIVEGIVLIGVVVLCLQVHISEIMPVIYGGVSNIAILFGAILLAVKSMLYLRGPQGGKDVALKAACVMHLAGFIIMLCVLAGLLYQFHDQLFTSSATRVDGLNYIVAEFAVMILLILVECLLGWIMYKLICLYMTAISEKTIDVEEA